MSTFSKDEIVYTVVVEFDGLTGTSAKSVYYRRLHNMGLYVRGGDKEKSVIERRFSSDGSDGPRVVMQESTVTCVSEQLARYVAHTAMDCGAAAVSITAGTILENIAKTRQDAEVINRIEEKAGKRGRKPPAEPWVCTCLECLTQTQQEVSYVTNCTNCGGLLIHTRKGTITPRRDPGGDVFNAWAALRFCTGVWEPCPTDDKSTIPTISPDIYSQREKTTLKNILSSGNLALLNTMDRESAFAFLDAILVAYAYDSQEKRIARRVRVITDYLMKGGNASTISFTEPTHPDIIDAAALGTSKIVGWLMRTGK